MTQDRRITDKLPGHPLQWDDNASPSAAPAAGQAGLAICEHCGSQRPLHLLTCPVAVKGMAEGKKKEAPEPLRQLLIDLSNNTYFCGLHLDDDAKYAAYLAEAEKAEQALIELFEQGPEKKFSRADVDKWRGDIAEAAASIVQRASTSFGSGDWSWLVNTIRGLAASEGWNRVGSALAAPVAADTEQATDDEAEYELVQDDMLVASTAGPDAYKEILHYAAQYEQDGPVEIIKVVRTKLTGIEGVAPLATPADAGAGEALTNARIIEIADQTRTAESRDGDYILPISFAREIEKELARLSKPGAPVTAEPAQSIDTPEFRALMAEHWKACGSVKANKAHGAVVMYVNDFIATHSALADRDAIRNEVLEEAARWIEDYQAEGEHVSFNDIAFDMRKLKSMERAADAAETRDAKGGE